ncbi:MAG: peptidoglycan editing factor PgeF [Desulfobacteraceae bacterium]|nr:peptidoglycan editing factor PgeF [Desulfobacteraceae bacterium]
MGKPEIKVFEFNLFQGYPDLIHGVFSRSGGVSSLPFDSLNVGLNSGDNPLSVEENRARILTKMGTRKAVFLNQVHGTDIHVLKNENKQELVIADGVVTDMRGISLIIQVADCQGVLLFDPVTKVIANVHSGWRGSIQNIIGNCIDVMTSQFECRPEHILAGISPSLGPCCAEFINYMDEIPKAFWAYKISGKSYFDFWQMSCDQMVEKGMKKENIEIKNICTQCNWDKFYSYRRENRTGRFACVISLQSQGAND